MSIEFDNEKIPVVFVDSQCVVCNGLVEWILARDKKEIFTFAGLNSDSFSEIKATKGLIDVPDSVVLYDGGEIYYKSTAVLRIFQKLRFPWSWLQFVGQAIPEQWRNGIYDWIARNRYGWFGQTEEDFCKMPDPKYRDRFLS